MWEHKHIHKLVTSGNSLPTASSDNTSRSSTSFGNICHGTHILEHSFGCDSLWSKSCCTANWSSECSGLSRWLPCLGYRYWRTIPVVMFPPRALDLRIDYYSFYNKLASQNKINIWSMRFCLFELHSLQLGLIRFYVIVSLTRTLLLIKINYYSIFLLETV